MLWRAVMDTERLQKWHSIYWSDYKVWMTQIGSGSWGTRIHLNFG